MRLIDADDFRSWLVRARRFLKCQDDNRTAAHAIGKIIEHLDKVPTADVEPVRHGKWVVVKDEYGGYARCSVCGDEFTCWEGDCAITNYCPSCGAKMQGGGCTDGQRSRPAP